jgi:glucose/arabinose dehydrogenase
LRCGFNPDNSGQAECAGLWRNCGKAHEGPLGDGPQVVYAPLLSSGPDIGVTDADPPSDFARAARVAPKRRAVNRTARALAAALVAALVGPVAAHAAPSVLDPSLAVRTAASGLVTPISIAFLGPNDMLVLEKDTGKVQRVVNGQVQSTVLDLAVNRASERGLLGIALHPQFFVNGKLYLYWTESSTGADSGNLADVPLLGNRIDRFAWNGSTLTFDANIVKLRAFQADEGQPLRGNHDGGVLRFSPDGKLYAVIGDNGRRGQLQNLVDGPFGPGMPDDQFGGPQPDNAHLTGVILRLNDHGAAPADNPFFAAGARMGGEVGANIQKIFAYGLRNSFGMAFDPVSGALWEQENGDDSFSEMNRADPGFNSGWVQIMGPPERIQQFKSIETTVTPDPPDPFASSYFGLQQIRWPPTNIADTPAEALSRLFMLPGAHYSAPELSWKYEVAPAGIGFLSSRALGPQYENDLFMGAARTFLEGGHLFRFNLTGNRRKVAVDDPRLDDQVADNVHKWEITESESLLFGRNFGIGTDVQTGPNGNLYVVSLTDGAVYEIFRRK